MTRNDHSATCRVFSSLETLLCWAFSSDDKCRHPAGSHADEIIAEKQNKESRAIFSSPLVSRANDIPLATMAEAITALQDIPNECMNQEGH
jgi:hypothetical protein